MQPSQKNGKKSNINSTQEIFSESDSQLTADLTEVEPDLTSSPPEALTEDLTSDLTEDLIPFTQVCQNIGISRETGYKRMELLKIKPWKNKGKSFLDSVQVGHMNDLHEYYKEQGNFSGYPVPERSGPWEEEAEHPSEEDNTTITVSQSQQLDTSTSESQQDTSTSESQQDTSTSESQQDTSTGEQALAPIGEKRLATMGPMGGRTPNTPEMEAINNLVRSAQNKATGVLIAENMIANQYIQNPESLPDELKAKIKESAQTPVIDPFAYANSLMDFARAGEAVG